MWTYVYLLKLSETAVQMFSIPVFMCLNRNVVEIPRHCWRHLGKTMHFSCSWLADVVASGGLWLSSEIFRSLQAARLFLQLFFVRLLLESRITCRGSILTILTIQSFVSFSAKFMKSWGNSRNCSNGFMSDSQHKKFSRAGSNLALLSLSLAFDLHASALGFLLVTMPWCNTREARSMAEKGTNTRCFWCFWGLTYNCHESLTQ